VDVLSAQASSFLHLLYKGRDTLSMNLVRTHFLEADNVELRISTRCIAVELDPHKICVGYKVKGRNRHRSFPDSYPITTRKGSIDSVATVVLPLSDEVHPDETISIGILEGDKHPVPSGVFTIGI